VRPLTTLWEVRKKLHRQSKPPWMTTWDGKSRGTVESSPCKFWESRVKTAGNISLFFHTLEKPWFKHLNDGYKKYLIILWESNNFPNQVWQTRWNWEESTKKQTECMKSGWNTHSLAYSWNLRPAMGMIPRIHWQHHSIRKTTVVWSPMSYDSEIFRIEKTTRIYGYQKHVQNVLKSPQRVLKTESKKWSNNLISWVLYVVKTEMTSMTPTNLG
jgi:hypothetical protein